MPLISTLSNIVNGVSALIDFFSKKQIAIYNASGEATSFNEVLSKLSIMGVYTNPTITVMKQPIETGQLISDHKIINPIQIQVEGVIEQINLGSIFSEARNLFETSTLLTVQTKYGTYTNMIISAMPTTCDTRMYDAVGIVLQMEEVLFVSDNLDDYDNDPDEEEYEKLEEDGLVSDSVDNTVTVTDLPPL